MLPTHSRQETEFQETEPDRSDIRETEDGGLSGIANNTGFFLFTFISPISLHIVQSELVWSRFKNGKSSRFSAAVDGNSDCCGMGSEMMERNNGLYNVMPPVGQDVMMDDIYESSGTTLFVCVQ